MGGGDLNLKKSWHPQTFRNVERVWKAEQKATAEAKKIEQLQRELMEERAREDMQRHAVEQGISKKKSDRLEWMYATPGQLDREQYLLGKAIDKHVDPLANESKEESNVPGTSFGSDASVNNPADLAAKIRDDPLFLIKKKEEEKKKELLNNPVKMKQLRQMLQENLGKSKKKEKKRKKDKKEKRRKVKSSSDSNESEDEQLHHSGKRKHERENGIEHSRQDSSSRHYDRHKQRPDERNSTESPDRTNRHRHKKRHSSESPDRKSKHRHNKDTPSPPQQKHRKHSRRSRSRSSEQKKHDRSPSPSMSKYKARSSQRNGHRDHWSRDERQERRLHSPVVKKAKRHSPSPSRKHRRDSPIREHRSRSPPRRDYQQSKGSAVTKKMTAEELEKRREEMLSNAQWRNNQRTANVKKYNETEKRETETEAKSAGKSAKFLSDMKVESFSSDSTASVTDRIKRNINSLQRTSAALDTFLVKK